VISWIKGKNKKALMMARKFAAGTMVKLEVAFTDK
jgi:hypothetical protein